MLRDSRLTERSEHGGIEVAMKGWLGRVAETKENSRVRENSGRAWCQIWRRSSGGRLGKSLISCDISKM